MTNNELDTLLDHRPQTTEIEFGPEPSLKEILKMYYLRHMNEKEANTCVENYIEDCQRIVGIVGRINK